MDCRLVLVGRFLAVLLLCVQYGFLTAFPAWYRDDKRLILLLLLFSPALIYYGICLPNAAKLRKVFCSWDLYIVFAIIFALCGDVLDKDNFLSPTCLKVILCITPVAFLILMNTASDLGEHENYKTLAWTLSVVITIDLVDSVEMLDIVHVLDERIPKEFGYAMIAAACVSFLLTLLQIVENFMAMRVVVVKKYEKDDNESIFITKNLIAIFLSAIYWISTGSERANLRLLFVKYYLFCRSNCTLRYSNS